MTLLKTICTIVGAMTLGWFIAKELDAAAFSVWRFGDDATDGKGRSGLALMTDAGTGCQYLASGWGGLTPRLNPDGEQVCKASP